MVSNSIYILIAHIYNDFLFNKKNFYCDMRKEYYRCFPHVFANIEASALTHLLSIQKILLHALVYIILCKRWSIFIWGDGVFV